MSLARRKFLKNVGLGAGCLALALAPILKAEKAIQGGLTDKVVKRYEFYNMMYKDREIIFTDSINSGIDKLVINELRNLIWIYSETEEETNFSFSTFDNRKISFRKNTVVLEVGHNNSCPIQKSPLNTIRPKDIIDQTVIWAKREGVGGLSYVYPSYYNDIESEYYSNGHVKNEYYEYNGEYYLVEEVLVDGKLGWHRGSEKYSIIFDKRYITKEVKSLT